MAQRLGKSRSSARESALQCATMQICCATLRDMLRSARSRSRPVAVLRRCARVRDIRLPSEPSRACRGTSARSIRSAVRAHSARAGPSRPAFTRQGEADPPPVFTTEGGPGDPWRPPHSHCRNLTYCATLLPLRPPFLHLPPGLLRSAFLESAAYDWSNRALSVRAVDAPGPGTIDAEDRQARIYGVAGGFPYRLRLFGCRIRRSPITPEGPRCTSTSTC